MIASLTLPDIELETLRRIGWDLWDPIGIRAMNDRDWRTRAADEYDGYLLHVAHLLRRGEAAAAAIAYLDRVVVEDMRLGTTTDARHAASVRTVEAVAASMLGVH